MGDKKPPIHLFPALILLLVSCSPAELTSSLNQQRNKTNYSDKKPTDFDHIAFINKFRLDKSFDEESLSFSVHRSTILSISIIIIIGGYIIVDNIPNLCSRLYAYFRLKNAYYPQKPDVNSIVLVFSKIIVGLLLIGNTRQIVNYIEYRTRKQKLND